MKDLQMLALKIDEFRSCLQGLIDEKEDLADEQIIYISKELDNLLNEYDKLQITVMQLKT